MEVNGVKKKLKIALLTFVLLTGNVSANILSPDNGYKNANYVNLQVGAAL